MMDAEIFRTIAQQLRRPDGEQGVQVAKKMNEGNLHINRATIDAMNVQEDDHILEIGMANGFFVKDILSMGQSVRYTGCDFSPIMVDEARMLNKHFIQSGQAGFYLADAKLLPFASETFNKAFTINTIYFWDDLRTVLAEIRRVLTPGGQLLISLRPKSIMQGYPFARYGFRLFSKDDVAQNLKENHFVVRDAIEEKEPDQEMNGIKVPVETLIVIGEK